MTFLGEIFKIQITGERGAMASLMFPNGLRRENKSDGAELMKMSGDKVRVAITSTKGKNAGHCCNGS